MSKTTKVLIGVIIAAIVIIGVAYAAISQIGLKVVGSAEAIVENGDNFNVYFTNNIAVTEVKGIQDSSVSASISTDDATKRTANVRVENLKVVGDSATIEFEVLNESKADVEAVLSAAVSNEIPYDTAHFRVTPTIKSTDKTIAPGETDTLVVKVELIAIDINQNGHSTDFQIDLTADPKQ